MHARAEQYQRLKERIEHLSNQAGHRHPATLVAVSKTFDEDAILQVYRAGCRDFGENRVQELCRKMETLPGDIRWHFVGKLQRNKARFLTGRVELIHSLDSLRLAAEIDKRARSAGICQSCLIEINLGDEDQKAGILPADLESFLREIAQYEHIDPAGLMCIPPVEGDPEQYFVRLAQLSARMREHSTLGAQLSMGMSADYPLAIRAGATLVRVGSAIFGNRTAKEVQAE